MHGAMTAVREQQQTDHNWYIVRCLRGSDEQAKRALENRGIETWYPKIVELRALPLRKLSLGQRSSGVHVRHPVSCALFPRYLFIQADLADYDWQTIFKESGVGGFTCQGDLPVVIRPHELAKIRSRENGGLIDGKSSLRVLFAIGDKVTVTSGPFAGSHGIVDEGLDVPIADLDPEARIRLLVNLFGRETRSEFALWQVAKNE